MPSLSDEDVGLGGSGLSDDDVGLEMEEGYGGETWSPEEQAKLESEEGGLAPETGLRAEARRLRAGPFGRAMFGPPQVEREAGAQSTGSPGEIAETMLKFTSVPPQLAKPIRAVTSPLIESLPAGIGGVAQGAQEFALNSPLAPIPLAPKTALTAFSGQYLAELPNAKAAYNAALERGDTKEAANLAAQTVLGGALLGAGAAHGVSGRFAPPERGAIPERLDPRAELEAAQRAREGRDLVGQGPFDPYGMSTENLLSPEQVVELKSANQTPFTPAPDPTFTPEYPQIKEPNAQRIREDTGQPKAPGEVAEGSEANRGNDVQQAASEQSQPVGAREAKPQEGNAQKEASPVLLDKSKWTKATDTENLRAATPEQRAEASKRPLDVESFLKEDSEGYRAVDPEKLKAAVEGGHVTSASPASDALLLHMLKESELHPLKSIRMLDFTPSEAQLLTGTSAPFHGKFSKKTGERSAMVELAMKRQNGQPISQAEFMETLTHEMVHNNITSKFKDAPVEIRGDVDNLFKFVKEKGKGTEFEEHNALTSVDELFAEMSDPKVHQWLSEMDYSADIRKADIGIAQVPAITPTPIRNSALGRFLEIAKKMLKLPDFIADAFGNKVDAITALDQMVSLSSRLERVQRSGTEALTDLSKAAENKPLEFWGYDPMTGAPKWKVPSEKSGRFTQINAEEAAKRGLPVEEKIPTKEEWDAGARDRQAAQAGAQAKAAEMFAPKVKEWTGATEEKPETGLGGQLYAGIPNPVAVAKSVAALAKQAAPAVKVAAKAVADAVRSVKRENLDIRKMTDLDRSVLQWSGKLQRSFGEAAKAQKDIQAIAKDPITDAALTNWMEAAGDTAKLTQWRDATTDPKLKAGYEAALKLTPEQKAMADEVRQTYDIMGQRGNKHDVLRSFKDDYVTHIWDLGKGRGDRGFAGGGRSLKNNFKFAKASTFKNYFEGEAAGFKPKTKRLSQLLPVYLHEMNSVIAARQLVKQMWKGGSGKASDGRPLLAARGIAEAVSGPSGESVLVKPNVARGDTSDYKVLANQPALHDWVWAGKDTKGNPIFEKSDLVLHPEAYRKLKAILGKSKIREWYETKTSSTMEIPKAIVRGLDMFQSETKRTMLGAISPFHQVQEGTHAVGHRVSPFSKVPKPNLENPAHLDAANHGLMILPDRASERNFTEGLRPSGLVSFIPKFGRLADHYSNYLFHEYIPGLKIKTYESVLERNSKVYAKELANGEVKPEDVKLLSAQQVNAAYGHLNYAQMGRDPTIQHIMQLVLLAPDFLEARARFAGQAIKGLVPQVGPKGERLTGGQVGSKVGREQLLALATLAVGQAALAFTSAKLTGGEWDGKHPFEFRLGNRRYTMRSVPEDLMRFAEDIHTVFAKGGGAIPFISNRVNPITGKIPLQLYTGRDWRGQKITPTKTLLEAAKAPIPLTARGLLGVDNSPLEEWEQLAGAAGLKIMRYSPQNEVREMFRKWQKESGDPRLQEMARKIEAETFGESDYSELRQALEKNNFQLGAKAYEKLSETKTAAQIDRAMKPYTVDRDTGATRDRLLPKSMEKQFIGTLTDKEREVYESAKAERRRLYQRFQKMLKE